MYKLCGVNYGYSWSHGPLGIREVLAPTLTFAHEYTYPYIRTCPCMYNAEESSIYNFLTDQQVRLGAGNNNINSTSHALTGEAHRIIPTIWQQFRSQTQSDSIEFRSQTQLDSIEYRVGKVMGSCKSDWALSLSRAQGSVMRMLPGWKVCPWMDTYTWTPNSIMTGHHQITAGERWVACPDKGLLSCNKEKYATLRITR